MPEHLDAGGARVLPQAACVLPARAATFYLSFARSGLPLDGQPVFFRASPTLQTNQKGGFYVSKHFATGVLMAALCLILVGCGSDGPNLRPELDRLTDLVEQQTSELEKTGEQLEQIETDLETEREQAAETQEDLQEQLDEAIEAQEEAEQQAEQAQQQAEQAQQQAEQAQQQAQAEADRRIEEAHRQADLNQRALPMMIAMNITAEAGDEAGATVSPTRRARA